MFGKILFIASFFLLVCCGYTKEKDSTRSDQNSDIDWNCYYKAEEDLNRIKASLESFLNNRLNKISIDDAIEFRELYSDEDLTRWGFDKFDSMFVFSVKFPADHINLLICHLTYTSKFLKIIQESQDLSYEIQKDRSKLLHEQWLELNGHAHAFKETVQISEFPWVPNYPDDVCEKINQSFENISF